MSTLKDHEGHTIVSHGPGWSGCRDCHAWIDTRAADAADTIRNTPALLAEARGWIADTFEGVTAHTLDSHGITALVARNYDGGTPEFVRNSAALLQAVTP